MLESVNVNVASIAVIPLARLECEVRRVTTVGGGVAGVWPGIGRRQTNGKNPTKYN